VSAKYYNNIQCSIVFVHLRTCSSDLILTNRWIFTKLRFKFMPLPILFVTSIMPVCVRKNSEVEETPVLHN